MRDMTLNFEPETVYQKIALYDCTNNVFTVKAQTLKLRKRSKKESKGPMVQFIPFYSIHLRAERYEGIWQVTFTRFLIWDCVTVHYSLATILHFEL